MSKDSIPLATVKQLLQQQREDFNSVIETLIRSFNERHDALTHSVSELKISLEYTQKDIDALKNTGIPVEAFTKSQEKIEDLAVKLDYQENQSRRNNLIFDGIMEATNESWTETENKIQDILLTKMGFTTCHTGSVLPRRPVNDRSL